jgi:hypothetical protein
MEYNEMDDYGQDSAEGGKEYEPTACPLCRPDNPVPHQSPTAAQFCRSGNANGLRPHCTCDSCF